MSAVISREIAVKVLEVVDAGLVKGLGQPKPGQMCVEAAVCYALGLPHGDDPACVSRALRSLKIHLNDSGWSSPAARAKGLRRLALAQLGSEGALDDWEFACRVAEMTIKTVVPRALRAAAKVHPSKDKQEAMLAAAERCEREGTRDVAIIAAAAANAAAANAVNAVAIIAANAASAANAAAANAIIAANAVNAVAIIAVNAVNANAAANAASAANADAYAARDRELSMFAESVVQILIEMKAPGCQWLDLADAPQIAA